MPKELSEHLAERGWTEEQIAEAEEALYSPDKQENHYGYLRSVSPLLYWLGLLVAIVANLIISAFLIPFFLILTSIQLYVVIATMGLIFGLMFNLILRDIEHVDYRHHVMAGVFIPVLGFITIYVVVNLANTFARIMKSQIHQSPIILSLIYVVTFSTPYLIYKYDDLTRARKAKKAQPAPVPQEQPKPKEPEFTSQEEAWQVHQTRKRMEQEAVQSDLRNKYRKFI